MNPGFGNKQAEKPAESRIPHPGSHSHSHSTFPVRDEHGHVVQFYEDDAVLVGAMGAFLGAGLGAGEAALVIATPEHRQALTLRLEAQGIDIPSALGRGQLSLLDARETLARFMVGGMPDEDLFMQQIGGMVAKSSVGRTGLRAFGEMVALLWEDRNPEAAIHLEHLWNKLGNTVAFSLLCAYPIQGFKSSAHGKLFARVCHEHSAVIPAESYVADSPAADRLRAIAVLQQKAQALEAEIAERKRIEEALRIATSELRGQVEEMKAVQEASRRYEAVLSESERRFRTMADSAPVLMWLTDAAGKCTYVNFPWLQFTGNGLETELARDPGDGVHPDDAPRYRETLRKAADARVGFHMEYRFRRADGAWRWLLDTGTPRRGEDGSFLGYIGSCVDITDTKDTEEQLRQAQKMEAVGRLAGGIAHDFNNLLTAINGYSEMALNMASEDATLSEFLSEIKRAGERAASLTQQLLAYSRKQILAPTVFDLNDTVADMERMLRRLIGEHIQMEAILAPGLGMVRADPGQVQQIILNLVLNARDAMQGGGRLTLETSNVIPDARPDQVSKPHVMLAVRDTGSGMSPDVKMRIFEPFFTTKDVGKGTGLGLSSVYGIIRQSGGFVTVDSEPGQGSVFRVHLPLAETDSGPSAGNRGTGLRPEGAANETILLVEDEETVRKFIYRTLVAQGYSVLESKDGPSALTLGEKCRRIDLLLTDVVMPNMNGAVLAERLKALHPGMGILFMSGYTDNVFLPGGLLEPGAKFLQKPFAQGDLLQKVKELLETRSRG